MVLFSSAPFPLAYAQTPSTQYSKAIFHKLLWFKQKNFLNIFFLGAIKV